MNVACEHVEVNGADSGSLHVHGNGMEDAFHSEAAGNLCFSNLDLGSMVELCVCGRLTVWSIKL